MAPFQAHNPRGYENTAERGISLGGSSASDLEFHRANRGTGETRDNNNKYVLVFLGFDYKARFTV